SSPTTSFTGAPGTPYVLQWRILRSCGATTDEVEIEFLDYTTVASAGPDKTVCGPTLLEGNAAAAGTGTWTIVNRGARVIAAADAPASGFSGVGGTAYTLRWTIAS